MCQYLVRVHNKEQSQNVQRIFFSLGYAWHLFDKCQKFKMTCQNCFFDPHETHGESYPFYIIATSEYNIGMNIGYISKNQTSLYDMSNVLELNNDEPITDELITMIVLGYTPFVAVTEHG